MTEDAILVHATLGGDKGAYGSLYDRYAPLTRALCFDATGNLASAQDLGQEVFLRAYKNLQTLREPQKFAPWLVAITKHVCKEWKRAKFRDRHQFTADLPETGREIRADCAEEISRLLSAVSNLPERERMAVHLFYLDEQTADDAKDVMELSRSGFYRVLERGMRRLRRKLGTGERVQ